MKNHRGGIHFSRTDRHAVVIPCAEHNKMTIDVYLDPEAGVVYWFRIHSGPCVQICELLMKSLSPRVCRIYKSKGMCLVYSDPDTGIIYRFWLDTPFLTISLIKKETFNFILRRGCCIPY